MARLPAEQHGRPSPSDGFPYVPALDGLRGVAILLVMAYHAFPARLQGGFLGVELFFVLSGFLITALLLKEWDRYGSISLPYFYMRRVLRLLPALLLLLVGVAFVDGLVFRQPGEIAGEAALSLGYMMNWARTFGWVGQSFLVHCWSLSIEEQFYLIWPALVAMMCRRIPLSELGRRLLVMAAVVALYRWVLVMTGTPALRLYNGLDTRADGLILGSALAAAFHSHVISPDSEDVRARFRRWLPVSIAGLSVAVIFADWRYMTAYSVYLPLTVICSTLLIGGVYLSATESRVRQLLESRTLVEIGRISYGLYLWHYPVYRMLGQLGYSELTMALVGTLMSVTLSVLSYRYVEQPMLSCKGRFSPAAAREKRTPGVAASV